MKKGIIFLLVVMLLLTSCRNTNKNNNSASKFESIQLSKEKHSEINFGTSEHDGGNVIRDFAITDKGNLLLLELSDKVHEYSPKGELIGTYDFDFEEKGLTAYMITCDNNGNFYFVDGFNNLIIKADRDGILNKSALGDKSIVVEPDLIKSIFSSAEDILMVTAVDPDDFSTYTYELDVSGEDAICISEPIVGRFLGNNLSFTSELIEDEKGALTDGASITIYENNSVKDTFEIHSTINKIFGVEIYGLIPEGGYFARIFEFLENGFPQDTFVTLNDKGKVTAICDNSVKSGNIIRGYKNNTFILQFDDDGIIVRPLIELCSKTDKKSWFVD